MKSKKISAEKAYQIFIYLFVGVLVLCCVFPLVYVVGQSFTSEAEFLRRGNLMVIPYEPTLAGYEKVLSDFSYLKAFGVSVLRTAVGTVCTLTCTIITGYLLSKEDLPGNKILTVMIMITVLYGGGLIPTFLVIKNTGLLNSFWAMIIPGLVDTWSVLVFKQFFSGLPKEVIESAEMDGCGQLRLLTRIVLPMSTAVIAAISLFAAVAHWNSWFDALIYLPKNKDFHPFQLLLRNMFVDSNVMSNLQMNQDALVNSRRVTGDTTRMVVTVVGLVPILCVYPFLQKYFTAGMYVGAVKG